MIEIRKATDADVNGICRVCAEAYRDIYAGLLSSETIERIITEFYNPQRVYHEIHDPGDWNGWWVADENGTVIGAGGGGMAEPGVGEIYVLYVDPERRGEGIGTMMLDSITDELKQQGATEQWVSVVAGNEKGIPF